MGGLIGANLLVCWIREVTVFNLAINSNTNLHKAMSYAIVRAKIVFFDSNPIGRILTRFSKDMAMLDNMFPTSLAMSSQGMMRTVMSTIALATVNFWLFIPIIFLILYSIWVARIASVAMIEA